MKKLAAKLLALLAVLSVCTVSASADLIADPVAEVTSSPLTWVIVVLAVVIIAVVVIRALVRRRASKKEDDKK